MTGEITNLASELVRVLRELEEKHTCADRREPIRCRPEPATVSSEPDHRLARSPCSDP